MLMAHVSMSAMHAAGRALWHARTLGRRHRYAHSRCVRGRCPECRLGHPGRRRAKEMGEERCQSRSRVREETERTYGSKMDFGNGEQNLSPPGGCASNSRKIESRQGTHKSSSPRKGTKGDSRSCKNEKRSDTD